MSRPRLGPLAAALAAPLLLAAAPASGQEADTVDAEAARQGPERIGSFVHVRQDGSLLLVAPDTASSLNEGTRLFLRCRDGRREAFVAVTGQQGGLGNAQDGAAGQFRVNRGPWSDLEQWGANESGTAAFMAPERIPTFVGRASGAGLVEIRIVNPAGVRNRFVFRLEGMEEALSRLPCMGG